MSEVAIEPVVIAPPSRELGYSQVDAGWWWDGLSNEKVPELRWPAAYDTYDDMMANAQVSSVLRAVMMPILRTGWRIDGTGCDPKITEHVAGDMSLPIVGKGNEAHRGAAEERFSWAEHLETALEEMLGYGHSFYEQKAYLGRDGLWHLQKLGYRPPRTITKINVARDGGLVSLEQTPGPAFGLVRPAVDSQVKELDVGRIVVYVHGRKGGNWRGRSLLRPAYVPWLLNQRAKRVEMITAERTGSPLVVYIAGEGETDLSTGEGIARRVRAGQTAGVAIPHGADIKLRGIEGTLPDLDKVKQYNDDQIARGVLAHFLNLGTQTGSWALGSTFADFFTLSLQAVADEVRRVASRHIVRDIVEWNWPGARAPQLVFDEIGTRQDTIVQAIATLVGAGVLKPDEDLELFIRTTLGLPGRGAASETPAAADGPGGPALPDGPGSGAGDALASVDAATARNVVEMVQKVYLGVGKVVTADEARGLLNRAGASLDAPFIPAQEDS